jgi:amylosucrase
MFTLSGVPVLYSGDEIAQENDYSYHDDPVKAEDSRYLHRGRMDWKKAEKRKEKDGPEGRVFAEIVRQEAIRAEYGVFDDDADVWIINTGNERVIGIGRYFRGEKLLALFNFSKDPQTAWIHDESTYTDLESGKRCKAGAVKIPSGGFRWLYRKMNNKS